MFRLLSTLITLAAVAFGGWYIWNHSTMVRDFVMAQLDTGDFFTLEARYSPEQVMEKAQSELLKSKDQSFLQPILTFYPYLLLEVKFSKDSQTGEGMILWSQTDGEMVLNTTSWEKTHGFEDCIQVGASVTDFRVVNTLYKRGNKGTREDLLNNLYVDTNTLDSWIESCKQKYLIVQSGPAYRLHFENPKFPKVPVTEITQWVVTKPYKGSDRIPRTYSESQIKTIAKCSFGDDFAIRKVTEVFLPVYTLRVKNPDASVYTSQWNALSGKRLQETITH